jgi:hypothetical protein
MISGTPVVATTDGGKSIEGWRCGLAGDGTSIVTKYLPSSCRGLYPSDRSASPFSSRAFEARLFSWGQARARPREAWQIA